MPKLIRILVKKNIGTAIIEDKNTFIQLLVQKFLSNSCNIITDKKASAKLSYLSQNEDKDLYAYYCYIKCLLKGIYAQEQVTHNGNDTVNCSLSE